MHAHPDDAVGISVQDRQRTTYNSLVILLYHQRVHHYQSGRRLQWKHSHVKFPEKLGTGTLIRMFPRLLLGQRSLEHESVKRLQRFRGGIQDGITNHFNPRQLSAAIVFCKIVPGLVAVREPQILVQQVHNGPILFESVYLSLSALNKIKFGFQLKPPHI
jgi:hypothetical protein